MSAPRMVRKAYTVEQIDGMRKSVRNMFGVQREPSPEEIEQRLRTYMLNGTAPEELARVADEAWKQSWENLKRSRDVQLKMMSAEGRAA